MLSKMLVPHCRGWGLAIGAPIGGPMGGMRGSPPVTPAPRRARIETLLVTVRHAGHFIPPSQYDMPIPKKLMPGTAIRVNWEVIPLFAVTGVSLTILAFAIIWACRNKVDADYEHTRENISRTMDLRNPSVHKMILINQYYDPWPEMQDVLDKMHMAEKRAKVRAMKCP